MMLQSLSRTEWRRLAAGDDLGPNDIEFLAETRDVPTAAALTRNGRVRLTAHAMRALAEIGKYNSGIARDLARRPEVSDSIARTLYPFVPDDVKAQLRTYFPVETAVKSSSAIDAPAEFMPGENVISAADQFARHGLLEPAVMLKALSLGHLSTFVAFFAAYAGLTPRQAHDGWGEAEPRAMAVVCRAKGFSRDDFKRLYLLTSRLRGADRPVAAEELQASLGYFERVTDKAAARLMARFGNHRENRKNSAPSRA